MRIDALKIILKGVEITFLVAHQELEIYMLSLSRALKML